MASNHFTSAGIPQPHIASCVTAHHHSPHVPHHSTSHHHISQPRLTLHDITSRNVYSTSHLIPHHGYIMMNKTQHPTSGIAKHSTAHQIPRHIILHHAMWCVIWWYWNVWNDEMWYCVLCRKCFMWNIVDLWWWYVECITHCHCISHLITSFHHISFTLHHST